MSIYKKPSKRVHRSFAYLDDETVMNSLSAVESGRIDEIVARVNSAREGGFGGVIGPSAAKLEGGKKSTSALEEEMVRTRTRFSVFENWYQVLTEQKALGTFDGWGPSALEGVCYGDTVEFRASIRAAPLQTLTRLFLWFADKAKSQGHPFSQKGEELKGTKEAERNMRMILGDADGQDADVLVLATPVGDEGPAVAMPIKTRWLICDLGDLGGDYNAIAQVERIVAEGEELPAVRLTRETEATPLEIKTLKDALSNFSEAAEGIGIALPDNVATIEGPALWLRPIAVYR